MLRGLFAVALLPVQDGRQQRRAETAINNGVLLPPSESELVNENWLLGYSFIQGMGITVHDEQNILMESHFNELDRRSGSLCTPTWNRDLCKRVRVSLQPHLICTNVRMRLLVRPWIRHVYLQYRWERIKLLFYKQPMCNKLQASLLQAWWVQNSIYSKIIQQHPTTIESSNL